MKRFSIAVALLLFALPALAITYGQADGKLHPNVGALVGEFEGQLYPFCSGALISPTVFLTAAHCNPGGTGRLHVTFASDFDGNAKLHAGTFHGDPLYNWAQNDPHDIAVVVLDQPVKGVAPARLPAAGSLGSLGPSQQFTAVGYGAQESPSQPGGPVIQYYDVREYSTSTLNSINPAWLRLSQNPATGNGGTCYGDSGGPNFLGAGAGETNVIAGVTVTGDMFCKSTNVIYRTDTPGARAFLGQFVTLP
ncbi:MAG TPA: trypsin-like serine protease [Thermoanaerobaculia bacterium]|nr:trypsin-like serine protease [Thermoanaerobaculia bacterium]